MINFIDLLADQHFSLEPFPHWIIPNILPKDLADQLQQSFPNSKFIHEYTNAELNKEDEYDQNTAYRLTFGSKGIQSEVLNELARSWISQKDLILDKIIQFCPPTISKDIELIKKISFSRGDFRASSPVKIEGTTQLGPHLDSSFEILAGLIYLRDPADESSGGDLIVYDLKDDAPLKYMSVKRRVPISYLIEKKVLPYTNNFGLFFISHPKAIHGISPRSLTNFDRQLINLSIELPTNQKVSLFNEEDFIDYSLTNQFRNKNLRRLQFFISNIMGMKKINPYGKYNWTRHDSL